MKKQSISFILLLLFGIMSSNISAKEKHDILGHLNVAEFYGRIDAIYPKASRLVIDDMVYTFTPKTHFQNPYGNTVLKLENTLKPGMWVKMHYIKKGDVPILTDIKVTTQRDVEKSRKISISIDEER